MLVHYFASNEYPNLDVFSNYLKYRYVVCFSLFFDEYREDLVNVLDKLVKPQVCICFVTVIPSPPNCAIT